MGRNSTDAVTVASRFVLVLAVVLNLLVLGFGPLQSQKGIESRLKAAYLLNFLQFVEWPTSAFETDQSPIILAVLGEDPFGPILDETFQSESVGEHRIILKRYQALEELGPCHALFISSSEKETLNRMLRNIRGPVLTVSDIDDFANLGGGIGFYREKNKLRFEINLQALKDVELKASSKLVRLAKVINPL